jgi:hypothetical protein
MGETGDHVKQNKPHSGSQILHVFFHLLNLDLKKKKRHESRNRTTDRKEMTSSKRKGDKRR